MAIDISNTFITLAGGCFFQTADGIEFSGQISAQQFCDTSSSPQQGSVSGYTSGGRDVVLDTIDKFPFSSDTSASDVGELTQARYGVAGQSSLDNGYSTGGYGSPGPTILKDTIDKFPFSSDTSALDVGELIEGKYTAAGHASTTFGYTSGGRSPTAPVSTVDTIEKFPFASDTNASDVGEIFQARRLVTGQSSCESGYTSAGGIPNFNTIDKFPFSSDTSGTDVGELITAINNATGQSSLISGYVSGGADPIRIDTIQKFPFATDTPATDVGELLATKAGGAGQNSKVSGYFSGTNPSGDDINKFPFATDTPATDVGELTQARYQVAGQQV